MAATFDLKRAKDGQFYFNLQTDGDVLLTSEMYTTRAAAENGIASVQKNGGSTERFEKKTASNGKVFFVLKAGNHQIIGKSELFANEAACDKGMADVQTHAATAALNDTTA